MIEEMNGNWLNKPAPQGTEIKKSFEKFFSLDIENSAHDAMDGLALGIAGDSVG